MVWQSLRTGTAAIQRIDQTAGKLGAALVDSVMPTAENDRFKRGQGSFFPMASRVCALGHQQRYGRSNQ